MKKILLFTVIFLSACAATKNPTYNSQPIENKMSDKSLILSAVEVAVKKQNHANVMLSAQYLKVNKNWAYVETTGGGDPSINAVLKKVKGQWMLPTPTVPCNPICPSGMSSCADGELICKNSLHQQFPQAPKTIFPTPSAKRRVFNK